MIKPRIRIEITQFNTIYWMLTRQFNQITGLKVPNVDEVVIAIKPVNGVLEICTAGKVLIQSIESNAKEKN